MEQPKQTEFTADAFIAWALQQPEGRFALDNGVVVARATGRVDDAIAKLNATAGLREAIRARGLDCRALPDGMAVAVNERRTTSRTPSELDSVFFVD